VSSLVLDTTALSHFARASRTDTLLVAIASDEPILLAEVAAELARGVGDYPSLGRAETIGWLKKAELAEVPELMAFSRYKGELGGGPDRNNGEAAVLAWVSINGGIAIIDEAAARTIGDREGLEVHGSLWLLVRGFKTGTFDRATVEVVADDLIGTGMRLPFSSGADLFAWAYEDGILP
jgi:predicted nucleic acid-binding protein